MLREIVLKHMPGIEQDLMDNLVGKYNDRRERGGMVATDQLLNAFYMVTQGRGMTALDRAAIEGIVLRELDGV